MEPKLPAFSISHPERRSSRAPFLLLLVIAISGAIFAQPPQPKHEFQRAEMGSIMRIVCFGANEAQAKSAADAAFARVEALNQICSDYVPDSELITLCQKGEITASNDLFNVISKAQEISSVTTGAFDITIGHLSQQWRRAKRKATLPTPEQLSAALALTNWHLVHLDSATRRISLGKPRMQLDLGGIAKGFAADEALKVLRAHGISQAVVAASGDMAVGDPPTGESGWPISLRTFEAPEDRDHILTLSLKNCGVSTSGDLHQFIEIQGKRYSHIMDPHTGYGLTQRIACSVIAPDATTSDALATAMCVLGIEKGSAALLHCPNTSARFAESTDAGMIRVVATEGFPSR